MFNKLNLILSALFVFTICACSSSTLSTSRPKDSELVFSPGDSRVGTYISTWNGFRTSSYWIEGPTGLIIIDTQFLLSEGERMLNWAEQTTGKKAVLAVVLHPNPDKFNGTALYQKRGIRVITSAQVLKAIPAVHKLRMSWFYDRFKPDYPSDEPKPESFGNTTQDITAAGVKLRLHVLGAGCSAAHVVAEFEGHFFVGDLITQGFHSWLELGQLDEWLKRIQEIRDMNPQYVHTGRGGSGDSDLIDREELYLKSIQKIVGQFKKTNKQKLTEATSEKIMAAVKKQYPLLEYPAFVENGLPEVWQNYKVN